MHDPNLNEPPFNPLKGPIVVLLILLIGVELVFQAAEAGLIGGPQGIGWRQEYARQFGFADPYLNWMIENRQFLPEQLLRFVTYNFIHHSFIHMVLVVAFAAALGKFVSEAMGGMTAVLIFMSSGILGALGYGLILDDSFLLLGGYPAVYGLIGAFTWVLYVGLTSEGQSGLPAFRLIGVFMAIQLIWKVFFGGSNEWLAELIGFLVGFGLSVWFSPGGWQRLVQTLARLRER